MEIQPSVSDRAQRAKRDRAEAASTARQNLSEQRARIGRGSGDRDHLEISDAARKLQDALAMEQLSISSRIPPEKLERILDRIGEGFYDRAEVKDKVIRGLARDLGVDS
jgi:restriction endonuclease Mrr